MIPPYFFSPQKKYARKLLKRLRARQAVGYLHSIVFISKNVKLASLRQSHFFNERKTTPFSSIDVSKESQGDAPLNVKALLLSLLNLFYKAKFYMSRQYIKNLSSCIH